MTEKNSKSSKKLSNCETRSDIFYNLCAGIGSFALGIGGCIAAWQTNSILDKVNALESKIEKADRYYTQSNQLLRYAYNVSSDLKIQESFAKNPELSNLDASTEQIKKIINTFAYEAKCPTEGYNAAVCISNASQPHVKADQVDDVVTKLKEAKSVEERKEILRNEFQLVNPVLDQDTLIQK
jgi:hypothetical protein